MGLCQNEMEPQHGQPWSSLRPESSQFRIFCRGANEILHRFGEPRIAKQVCLAKESSDGKKMGCAGPDRIAT